MTNVPPAASLKKRLSARLFGGASGNVFRGMATLALGNGIGRVIGIAAIPVLTRLYTPEDFGVLAVFTALVAIFAPLVTLRYALALPLPRHDGVAMNLLALSTGLMLALTGLFALALWLWGAPLLALVSMEVLAPWWWLIAVGVLGASAYELLTMWATRGRAYRAIAQTNVTQSAVGAVIKIGLGLASVQPLGLLVGQVVAQTGGVGRLLGGFRTELCANWRHVRISRMRTAAWRHQGFPIYRMPSQIMLMFSKHSPVLFIAATYGATTGGQFGLAITVVSLPIGLLGSSVAQALYGEAARIGMNDPARLLQLAKATQTRLFIMALGPAGILFAFGPSLFRIVFGSDWEVAGNFVSILSIYLLFQFTSAPMMQMMNLLDAQRLFLVINMFRAAGVAGLIVVATHLGLSDMQFVTAFSLFNAATYFAISAHVILRLQHAARKNR